MILDQGPSILSASLFNYEIFQIHKMWLKLSKNNLLMLWQFNSLILKKSVSLLVFSWIFLEAFTIPSHELNQLHITLFKIYIQFLDKFQNQIRRIFLIGQLTINSNPKHRFRPKICEGAKSWHITELLICTTNMIPASNGTCL